MEEIERAIGVALSDDSTNDIRATANKICIEFESQPDAWLKCIEQFSLRSSRVPEAEHNINNYFFAARFWYLKVVSNRLDSLNEVERNYLRDFLFLYLNSILPYRSNRVLQQFPLSFENPSVLSAITSVYSKLLVYSYPEIWPSAVTDLSLLWKKSPNREVQRSYSLFFLGVWEAFHDSILSSEKNDRHTLVKDALREGDILLVTEICIILISAEDRTLVEKALIVLSKLIVWLDVQLIANVECLTPTFKLIAECSSCATAGLSLIAAMFHKRMDSCQRIVMASKLNLVQNLISSIDVANVSSGARYLTDPNCEEPNEYSKHVYETFDTVGEELINALNNLRSGFDISVKTINEGAELRALGGVEAAGINPFFTPLDSVKTWTEIQEVCFQLINDLVPTCLLLLSHPHPSLCVSLLPFATAYNKLLKSIKTADSEESTKFINDTFRLVIEKVKIPQWLKLGGEEFDEETCNFEHYRTSLANFYKSLYSIDPLLSNLILSNCLTSLKTMLSSNQGEVTAVQVESLLFVIYITGEYFRDIGKESHSAIRTRNVDESSWTPEEKIGNGFIGCLAILFSIPGIVYNDNPGLQNSLYLLFGRYLPYIVTNPYLPEVVVKVVVRDLHLSPKLHPDAMGRCLNMIIKLFKHNELLKFAGIILPVLVECGVLTIYPIDQNSWPRRPISSRYPHACEWPLRYVDSFFIDDQEKAFEIVGTLLMSLPDCEARFREILVCSISWLKVPISDLTTVGARLCQVDLICRTLKCITSLYKNAPSALDADCSRELLQALGQVMISFSGASRVRTGVVSLTRRFISSPKNNWINPSAILLLPMLMDVTLISFVETESCAMRIPRLSRVRQESQLSKSVETSFSGHLEFCQVLSLLNLVVSTVDDLGEANHRLESVVAVPGYPTNNIFTRCFTQAVDVLEGSPTDSSECIRESEELLRELCQLLVTLASKNILQLQNIIEGENREVLMVLQLKSSNKVLSMQIQIWNALLVDKPQNVAKIFSIFEAFLKNAFQSLLKLDFDQSTHVKILSESAIFIENILKSPLSSSVTTSVARFMLPASSETNISDLFQQLRQSTPRPDGKTILKNWLKNQSRTL